MKKLLSVFVCFTILLITCVPSFAESITLSQYNISVSGDTVRVSQKEFKEMIKASPLAAKLDVIKNVTSQEDILLTPEMLLILAVYAHPENEIANELQKLQNRDVTISYNDSCYTIFSIDKVATASRGGEGEVIKRGSVEALNFNNHYGLEVALSVVFREVWEGGLNASFEYKRYSKTLKAKAGYIKDSIDKEYISNSSGLRSAKDCYFSYYFKGRHSKLTSYQAIFHP